jgi:plasmid stabilization system protein ParE
VKAEFTDFAKLQLRKIYNYYAYEVSENTALKVISKILDAIDEVETHPSIGTKEPLLSSLNGNHKFIVAGNYKIIFHIEAETIYITDIFFDGRQEPSKIITRNMKQ